MSARAIRLVVAGVLALGLSVAPGASAAPAATGATVSDVVVGFTFVVGAASLNAPEQALRIRTGDTMEWTNLDPVGHSIAFNTMPTVLYLKKPGDRAAMTFTQPGYYHYTCPEHPNAPGMQGLVFVTDDAPR